MGRRLADLFSGFLTRSGCRTTLTSLRLDSPRLSDTQAIALLQLLPMLTTLEIVEEQQVLESGGRPITGTFLKHFVVPHQPEVLHTRKILFPRLTDPVFRVAQKNEMVEQDFYDAISSRWIPDPALAREIGVACLRSARITVMWRLSPDPAVFGLSSLECFGDAGLRLEAAHKIALW
ncbi:hypothetical protein PM082_010383 [Marasmius tenuissimus]|nr:hypothetical protein PM082_010383 [Marasmius tenuissimus]